MNIESLAQMLHLAYRQRESLYELFDLLKQLVTFKIPFSKIIATISIIFQLCSNVALDTPVDPHKGELDLTGYELIFEDQFEGNSLDSSIWNVYSEYVTRSGFGAPSQIQVGGGKLVMTGEYLENGPLGAGWYGARAELIKQYRRGYFEMSAIISKNESNTHDFWSAFWITSSGCYDHDICQGGPGGMEIDIMESHSGNYLLDKNRASMTGAIWGNGGDADAENIDGRNVGSYRIKNPWTEYHTYGLMWTETEYTWYIDGVACTSSSYVNGVSEVPEIVTLSMEVPTYTLDGNFDTATHKAVFSIDYVRIYQLPQDIQD